MQHARVPLRPHAVSFAHEATGIARIKAKTNKADNMGLAPLFGAKAAKLLAAAGGSWAFWELDKDRPANFGAAVLFRDLLSSIDSYHKSGYGA
jgi:hypothetical protein